MKKTVLLAFVSASILAGCGTPQVVGFAPQDLIKPDEVCIMLDSERMLPKLPSMIQKAFEKFGVKAHMAVFREECPCSTLVEYRYKRKWDLKFYLDQLQIVLVKDGRVESKAAYISSNWSASKYSEQEQVDNTVRKLLGEKKAASVSDANRGMTE